MESEDLHLLAASKEDLETSMRIAPSAPQTYYYMGSILHRTALITQSLRMNQGIQMAQSMTMVESMQIMGQAKEKFEEAYRKFPNCCEGLVLFALVS